MSCIFLELTFFRLYACARKQKGSEYSALGPLPAKKKKKKGANSKLKYEDTGIKDIQHAKLAERVKFNLSTVIIECGSFSQENAGT
jgi:hypothetical protein